MQELHFWLSKSHKTKCGHQLLVTMLLIKKSICYVYCLCDHRVTAALKRVSKFCDFFFAVFFNKSVFKSKTFHLLVWKKLIAVLQKINSCFGKKKQLARRSKREAVRRFSLSLFRGESYINFHTQYDVRRWRDYHEWIWKFVYWNLLLLYLSNHWLKKIINQKNKTKNKINQRLKALAIVSIACVCVLLQPICTLWAIHFSLVSSSRIKTRVKSKKVRNIK